MQLAAGMGLTLLAGLAIGYGGRSGTESPSAIVTARPRSTALRTIPTVGADPTPPLLDLPPDPARPRTPEVATTALPSLPSTVVAPTTTTLASAATTPGPSTGSERVLLNVRSSGSQRTQHFTVASGGWKLGWGYDCSNTSGAAFGLRILNGDGTPGQEPAVSRSEPRSSGVEQYQTAGDRMLEITTSCRWEVKVVGVAS